jgi:hypothetical protein
MYTWVMFGEGGFGGRFLHSPETFQLYIRNIMYITYCHGRLFLCGETSTQLPRKRLNLRWDISFRIGSDMVD